MFKILFGLVLAVTITSCTQPNSSVIQNPKENEVISLEAKSMVITGALDFGTILSTDSSKLVTFTLKNNGTENLVGPASIDNSNFTIAYQNCGTVAPTKSCTVKVSFNPAGKSGPYTSTLTLDSATGNLIASVTPPAPPEVSALFLVSSVDVSSTGLDFGTITDKQSLVKTISIKNNGQAVISAPSVVLGANYVLSYDACSGKDLAKGSSCSVKVTLNGAGKSGAISDSLQFAGKSLALSGQVTATSSSSSGSSGSSGSSIISYFNGTTALAGSYNYGTLSGTQSSLLVLTVKNIGTLAFSGGPVSLSSTDFSMVYNACNNKSLAPGASCSVRVSFSASGKQPNTYTGTLSLGGSNLSLTGTVQSLVPTPIITYSAQYSSYSACSAQVCDGTGIQSRTISTCRKLSDGVDIGSADISFCSAFNVPANLQQSCQSPAGNKTIAVSNGSKEVSCSAGSSVQNLVSLTCDNGYNNQAGACVSDSVSYVPSYSAYSSCSAANACDGSGQKDRTIVSCQKILNGTPVSGGQLSDCASFNTPENLQQSCQSPEGQKVVNITNGTLTTTCLAGQTTGSEMISCEANFHELQGSCIADVVTFEPSYSAFGACSAQACDGTGLQSRTLESCQKKVDGSDVPGGQLSDCSAYNTAGYLDQPCFSPAGDIVSQISNGSSTMTCSEGQTSGPIAISCIGGYHENAGACDQNTYIATYPVNNLQACEGTQSVQPISCRESWGSQIDVSLSLCPNEDQQSPAGVQSTPITGGTSNLTCQAGQSTGTTDISCSGGYTLSNNSCVQQGYSYGGFQLAYTFSPGTAQSLTSQSKCIDYTIYEWSCWNVVVNGVQFNQIYDYQPWGSSYIGCGIEGQDANACTALNNQTYYDQNSGMDLTTNMSYVEAQYQTYAHSTNINSIMENNKIFFITTPVYAGGDNQDLGIYVIDSNQVITKIYDGFGSMTQSSTTMGGYTYLSYYEQNCSNNCYKMIKTDGTPGGTSLFKTMNQLSWIDSDGTNLFVYGKTIGAAEIQIYKMDLSGNVLAQTTGNLSNQGIYSSSLTKVNNEFYLEKGTDLVSPGKEIYKMNKTDLSFNLVQEFSPGSYTAWNGATAYNGTSLYASNNFGINGNTDTSFTDPNNGDVYSFMNYKASGSQYYNNTFIKINSSGVSILWNASLPSSSKGMEKFNNKIYMAWQNGGGEIFGYNISTPVSSISQSLPTYVIQDITDSLANLGYTFDPEQPSPIQDTGNWAVTFSNFEKYNNELYFVYNVTVPASYSYDSFYRKSYLMKINSSDQFSMVQALTNANIIENPSNYYGSTNTDFNTKLLKVVNSKLLIIGKYQYTYTDYMMGGYSYDIYNEDYSSVYNSSNNSLVKLSQAPYSLSSSNLQDLYNNIGYSPNSKQTYMIIGNTVYIKGAWLTAPSTQPVSGGSELFKFQIP